MQRCWHNFMRQTVPSVRHLRRNRYPFAANPPAAAAAAKLHCCQRAFPSVYGNFALPPVQTAINLIFACLRHYRYRKHEHTLVPSRSQNFSGKAFYRAAEQARANGILIRHPVILPSKQKLHSGFNNHCAMIYQLALKRHPCSSQRNASCPGDDGRSSDPVHPWDAHLPASDLL